MNHRVTVTEGPVCEPITDAIVSAVADAEGTDPLELPPLWNVVDPEALEELFAPSKRDPEGHRTGRVGFVYHGYDVVVEHDGSTRNDVERRLTPASGRRPRRA